MSDEAILEDLYWAHLEPGAVVRLAEGGEGETALAGIVARVQFEPQPLVYIYPFDASTGGLQLSSRGVPRAMAVHPAQLEVFNHDRRSFPRLPGECTLYLDRDEGIPIAARIVDLSLEGVGFSVGRQVAPGQEIRLGFLGTARRRGLVINATVRSLAALGSGRWRVGCQFERRLSPEELASFVP